MLLIKFDCEDKQNFYEIQDFVKKKSSNSTLIDLSNFKTKYHYTQINILFLENEIRLYYSLPIVDEYDVFIFTDGYDLKEFLLNFYEQLSGKIHISSFITYEDTDIPNKYIYLYLPNDIKDEVKDFNAFFDAARTPSCTICTTNQDSKEIYFTYNTHTAMYGSITNIIDAQDKPDYIVRYFAFINLLLKGR